MRNQLELVNVRSEPHTCSDGAQERHGYTMDDQEQAFTIPQKVAERVKPRDLANTWMTRGIALLQANTRTSLEESVRCFDQAIELRRAPASPKEPWLLFGLAAAWMNGGDALSRFGTSQRLEEAVRSYDQALAVLLELQVHEH